jgi:hypothetical protein
VKQYFCLLIKVKIGNKSSFYTFAIEILCDVLHLRWEAYKNTTQKLEKKCEKPKYYERVGTERNRILAVGCEGSWI